MGEEGPVANGHRRRASEASKLSLVAGFGILVLGSVISAVPAAATSGIGVYVAYADSLRADPTNFPTPWAGSPRTVFQGCAPVQACTYDGGAVQVLNNTGSTVTVNAITVHIDTCTYTGWLPTVLAPGAGLIVTQLASGTNSCGQPLANVNINFAVQSGPNAGRTGSNATSANGTAPFSYSSAVAGADQLGASITNLAGTIPSNTVLVIWVAFAPGGGAFVISDLRDVPNGAVYWWGAQWWKQDPLSSGLAPAAFKGYELSNATPWCGQTWTTRPGNSPHPPSAVPNMMAVIVASHVSKKGSVISGDIVHVVLVQTRPGYGPNPGHVGTGTIIRTLC